MWLSDFEVGCTDTRSALHSSRSSGRRYPPTTDARTVGDPPIGAHGSRVCGQSRLVHRRRRSVTDADAAAHPTRGRGPRGPRPGGGRPRRPQCDSRVSLSSRPAQWLQSLLRNCDRLSTFRQCFVRADPHQFDNGGAENSLIDQREGSGTEGHPGPATGVVGKRDDSSQPGLSR